MAHYVATLLLCSVASWFHSPAFSTDELHFRDGGVLKGRIVRQDDDGVSFGVLSSSGIEVVLNYEWREIVRVVSADGSQSDTSRAIQGRDPKQDRIQSVEDLKEGKWLRFNSSAAIVPLHGEIGGDHLAHPWYVDWIINHAASQSLSLLIFEVDTLGGFSTSGQTIRDLFLKSHGDLEIGVWIKEAGSAGAGISASASRRFVSSTARIGAAQTIVTTSDGKTVSKEAWTENDDQRVVEKFASYSRAQLRIIEQKTGFPACVLEAMSVLESQLWWSETNGFSGVEVEDALHIDKDNELLTFTGDEFYRYGLAEAQIDTVESLIQHLPSGAIDLRADVSEAFSVLEDVFEKEEELVQDALQDHLDAIRALQLALSHGDSFFTSDSFNPRQRPSSRDLQTFHGYLRDYKREIGSALKKLEQCEYRQRLFFESELICITDFRDYESVVKRSTRIRKPVTLGDLNSVILELRSLQQDQGWCF